MDLQDQVAGPLRLLEEICSLDRLEPLDGFRRELVGAVRQLIADEQDALRVSQAIAHVNDALTRRLLELAEADLGPPPAGYAWLALGSQGRGEQVLSSDQDSAIAVHDGAAGPWTGYFSRLAALVVTALARAGQPLCDGGYMATNWCRPIGDFRAMFRGWVERPEPEALLRAEVFLDVRRVHGDLAVDTLGGILVAGGSRGQFLVQMARAAVTFEPPLGLFGRLPAGQSSLDVKRAGTAPVVLLGRLYALAGGSGARSTVERLAAAAAAGTLSHPGATELIEGYRLLTGLRLRHQVEQLAEGGTADNRIRLDRLTAAERRRLRDVLRAVRDVQQVTAVRFGTHTVT